MSVKKDVALFWLKNGFALLPCQPGKKSLVSGYGIYKARITDAITAGQWWEKTNAANIAVIAPDGFFILDFDDLDLYQDWIKVQPVAAGSYTEITPSGGSHVFLRGNPPRGCTLKNGVELKAAVVVYPSIVDGGTYKPINGVEILEVDPIAVLSSLSEPGHATPSFLQANQTRQASTGGPLSRIAQIKKHYTISHVLKVYRPDLVFDGRNDWLTCRCPFHEDRKPSFYFSDSLGVWGCHACKVRGDVINLYARFEAVNMREAITRMWAVMA